MQNRFRTSEFRSEIKLPLFSYFCKYFYDYTCLESSNKVTFNLLLLASKIVLLFTNQPDFTETSLKNMVEKRSFCVVIEQKQP